MSSQLENLLKILEDTKKIHPTSIKDYPANIDILTVCKCVQACIEEDEFGQFLESYQFTCAMATITKMMVYDLDDMPNYEELMQNKIYKVCKFVFDWTLADINADPECEVNAETFEDFRKQLYELPAEYVLLANLQIVNRTDGLAAVYDTKPDIVELIENSEFPSQGKDLVGMFGAGSFIEAFRMLKILRTGDQVVDVQAELPSFN